MTLENTENIELDDPSVESVPKRGRGRPRKSESAPRKPKTEPTAPLQLPPEAIAFVANIPLEVSKFAAKTYRDIYLDYSNEQRTICAQSLEQYLKSRDIQLTPGWVLILTYSMIIGSSLAIAVAQGNEHERDTKLQNSSTESPAQNI